MKGFAIDMDGTVYHGGRPIPGALEFIEQLKARNIPFRFLTNNSSRGRAFFHKRLTSMGFDIPLDSILTSTAATLRFIKEKHPGRSVFPLGVPEFEKDIKSSGIRINYKDPDIVLLSFDTTITYDKINMAYRLLKKGKTFIATHPDDLCPTEDGYDIDIGPFIRLFQDMTGAVPEIIGKPNRRMLEMAALDMGIDPGDVIMVGDRLYTDIRMAHDSGIESVAVLTGETTMEMIDASEFKPTYICESVADILKRIHL